MISIPFRGSSCRLRRRLINDHGFSDILTDTDSGTGYGIEDAEDNTANLISSITGGSTTSGSTTSSGSASAPPPPPPPPPPPARLRLRRQLDKISNGAGAIGDAAGLGTVTDPVAAEGDSVDGK